MLARTRGVFNGNIPAYAGKTWSMPCSKFPNTEHPRVCGENDVAKPQVVHDVGTSPRMRGKPWSVDQEDDELWNIPAYAGKTVPLSHWR